MTPPNFARASIAYFSMEIALEEGIPTYSGGLGMLAGDLLRSASDLNVPMVGVTLAMRAGYFRQQIVDGLQVERSEPWDPAAHAQRLPFKVVVRIGGRDVWVGAWEYLLGTHCHQSEGVPVVLLDTDLPENAPEDRRLTDSLYGGEEHYRLQQEMVLGLGGLRMLRAMGVRVHKYHLNEGHSALLTLELLNELGGARAGGTRLDELLAQVRRRCVFTTHTPVAAGHDQFDYALAENWLGHVVSLELLHRFGGPVRFNLTQVAMHLCGWVNGVAERHALTSRKLFPGYDVQAVTNGVHAMTWTCTPFQEVFDRHVPKWCHEPELLARILQVPDAEVRAAHAAAKQDLLRSLDGLEGAAQLDPGRCTLGFARRMTDYKRPGLLFSDLERLQAIAQRLPFQLVVAGKAHPRDEAGKQHIAHLHAWARALAGRVTVVFVPDYRMEVARRLVAGVDVWVNTPLPPLEASGTSGMKAALNGVPSLSVLDGWWIEGCQEGVTGWAIGADGAADPGGDAASLYDKLERQVLPGFYEDTRAWSAIMKSAIAFNGSYFNSHRMLRRYAAEAYWHG